MTNQHSWLCHLTLASHAEAALLLVSLYLRVILIVMMQLTCTMAGGGGRPAHLGILFRGAHQQLHHFTVVADQPSMASAAAAACQVGITDLVSFAQG